MFLFFLCDFPSLWFLNFLSNDIYYEQIDRAVIASSVFSKMYLQLLEHTVPKQNLYYVCKRIFKKRFCGLFVTMLWGINNWHSGLQHLLVRMPVPWQLGSREALCLNVFEENKRMAISAFISITFSKAASIFLTKNVKFENALISKMR